MPLFCTGTDMGQLSHQIFLSWGENSWTGMYDTIAHKLVMTFTSSSMCEAMLSSEGEGEGKGKGKGKGEGEGEGEGKGEGGKGVGCKGEGGKGKGGKGGKGGKSKRGRASADVG